MAWRRNRSPAVKAVHGYRGGPAAASPPAPGEARGAGGEGAPGEALPAEISFLEGRHIDRATLVRVAEVARRCQVSPEQVLLNAGLITQTNYYRALGAHIGLGFSRLHNSSVEWLAFRHPKGAAMARANIVPLAHTARGLRVAIAPRGPALRRLISLSARPDTTRLLRDHLFVATPRDVSGVVQRGLNREILRTATGRLAAGASPMSARGGLGLGQKSLLAVAAALLCAALAAAPGLTLAGIAVVLAFLFAGINILRIAMVLAAARKRPGRANGAARTRSSPRAPRDDGLPVYTLLVPVFREAAILAQLVTALRRLDYPASKLDIKLIFEADDRETIAVARVLRLPAHFHLVIVPRSRPQTKPKALNFALQLARGSLVAVYDAEDRPEPNQLRRAVAAFAAGPPDLACVQARLGFYNTHHNWLTRQFAVEYAALFDAQLPALAALRLPIPLGGTSNHFRRDRLEAVGAWDPYNVTEDADLGIRLARWGYRCAILDSHTHEAACSRFPEWLGQRTRWIKGWLQTYFVHMRSPRRLWRELGAKGFVIFNILIAGTAVSALAHPVFVVVILHDLTSGIIFANPASAPGLGLAAINIFNLTVGYAAAILLGWIGVNRRGLAGVAGALKWMPAYWLLISLAAYRALWDLARRPFHWEKTDHAVVPFRV